MRGRPARVVKSNTGDDEEWQMVLSACPQARSAASELTGACCRRRGSRGGQLSYVRYQGKSNLDAGQLQSRCAARCILDRRCSFISISTNWQDCFNCYACALESNQSSALYRSWRVHPCEHATAEASDQPSPDGSNTGLSCPEVRRCDSELLNSNASLCQTVCSGAPCWHRQGLCTTEQGTQPATFNSPAELLKSPWRRYYEGVYGASFARSLDPVVDFPWTTGYAEILYVHHLRAAGLSTPQLSSCSPQNWRPRDAIYSRRLTNTTLIHDYSLIEISRCSERTKWSCRSRSSLNREPNGNTPSTLPNCVEQSEAWMYHRPGSGVYYDVGRVAKFLHHKDAMLACNLTCRGMCTAQFGATFACLRERRFDTVVFTEHIERTCGRTGVEVVALRGDGQQCDGNLALSHGWRGAAGKYPGCDECIMPRWEQSGARVQSNGRGEA